MAFGNKFFFDFNDFDGLTWRIQIAEEAFVGANTEVDKSGLVPATFKMKRSKWLFGDVIKPTELIVSMIAQTDFEFKDFFDADDGDFKVQLIEDPAGVNTIMWEGLNVSEIYTEPYVQVPYPIQVSFADGINELEKIKFEDIGDAAQFTAANSEFLSNGGTADLRGAATGWWRSIWINRDSGSAIQELWECIAANTGHSVTIDASNNVFLKAGDGSTQITKTHSATIGTGTWTFIYVELAATTIGISINGGALETAAFLGTYSPGVSGFNVGSVDGLLDFYDGGMDSFNGGDGQLSPSQIRDMFKGGKGQSFSNRTLGSEVKFWFDLEEVSGTRVDSVINANNLADNNTVTQRVGVTPKFFADQKHIIEVLRIALNKLPYQLSIKEIVNIYEDDHTESATDSPLTQTFVSTKTYRDAIQDGDRPSEEAWDCRRVVEEVLREFGVRMFQWDHVWYIIRIDEWTTSTFTFRQFAPAVGSESGTATESTGTLANTVTFPAADRHWKDQTPVLEINPKVELITHRYKSFSLPTSGNDLIRNGNFILWEEGAMPLYWRSGTGLDETAYDTKTGKFNDGTRDYFGFKFRQADLDGLAAIDTTISMEMTNENIFVSATDTIRISFDFSIDLTDIFTDLNGAERGWAETGYLVSLWFKISLGSFDLVGDFQSATWQSGASEPFFKFDMSPFNTPQIFFTAEANRLSITKSITTPTLPETGERDFTFTVYAPFTNLDAAEALDSNIALTINEARIGNLYGIYLPADIEPTDERVTSVVLDIDAREEEIIAFHGDGPNQFSETSFRLSNGNITNDWHRTGVSENKKIHEILLEDIVDLRGDFTRKIKGLAVMRTTILELYQRYTLVVGADTTHYINDEFIWNIKEKEYQIEIVAIDSLGLAGTIADFNQQTFLPDVNDGPPPINIVTPQNEMLPAPNFVPGPSVPIQTISSSLTEDYPI